MARWTQAMLALALSVGVVACGGADRDKADGTPGATGTAGAGDAGIDRDFVEDMLADGNKEIELGRIVQDRAADPQVREFGAMMVRDHTKAGEDLMQLATRHNVQLSPDGNRDHVDQQERFSKLSGAEFDREYIDAMVDDHQQAVDDVRDRAENADNPELKQWAAKTLPSLEQHLARAKEIQRTLNERGDSGAPQPPRDRQ